MIAETENRDPQSTKAVYDLIERIAPDKSRCFNLELDIQNQQQDFFKLKSSDQTITITANSLSAMTMGLGWYFKNVCKTVISWHASAPIELPDTLPAIEGEIHQKCDVKNRFFLNYCTHGYTMPWWHWNDWDRLIDWMALNGINLTLATAGQEFIWLKVWQKFGLTEEQIRSYFVGPAHLPWHHMANIDRWQGPLPLSYIEQKAELQKKILSKLRSLGIKPILPAFNGHVPCELKENFPNANIKPLGQWAEFPKQYATYFLNPVDPLFSQIQQEYITQQKEEFGTDHYYGLDPFNEVDPPEWKPEYLAKVFAKTYNSLQKADDKAIWIQMGWMFYFDRAKWTPDLIKASLEAVPKHKMIMLDYWTEKVEIWNRTEAFYGTDYLWCYLGNFGGNTKIMGAADIVTQRYKNMLASPEKGNITGIGSTLEGMGVNQIMHDLTFEMPWQKDNFDLSEWFKNYGSRKAGTNDPDFTQAWQSALDIVHSENNNTDSAATSAITMRKLDTTLKTYFEYNNTKLLKIWKQMLNANDKTLQRDAVQYDIANFGRQVLANHGSKQLQKCMDSWKSKDKNAFQQASSKFLELFDDVNSLLATRSEFSLGKWLSDAAEFAKDPQEKAYYLHNARVILSTWGPKAHLLANYACREWADMTTTYYKPRWEKFMQEMLTALEEQTEFDLEKCQADVAEIEWEWTQSKDIPTAAPIGSTISIAKELFNKYAQDILSLQDSKPSENAPEQNESSEQNEQSKQDKDYFNKFT